MADDNTKIVKVKSVDAKAASGAKFSVEVIPLGGETRVSIDEYDFDDFKSSLEALTKTLHSTIQKIAPSKASIEFGIEIGVESGKLTALLVKGSGKANLKVTLEWN